MNAIAPDDLREPADRDLESSLVQSLVGLLKEWKIITATLLVCWSLGALLFVSMERQYESTALLRVAGDSDQVNMGGLAGRLSGVAAIAGLSLPSASVSTDLAIATLTSRLFLGEFIRFHQILPALFPDAWNARTSSWTSVKPSEQEAYEKLLKRIRITTDRQTGLVTMTVRWRDRERAAEWLNLLIRDLNSTLRTQAENDARKNLRFLEQELARMSSIEVRQSIYSMMEAQINKIMLANVREDYALRLVDPPVVSDKDKYVSPKPVLIAFLFTLGALFTGVMLILLLRLKSLR